jgi:hypothetical protein
VTAAGRVAIVTGAATTGLMFPGYGGWVTGKNLRVNGGTV